MGRKKATLPVSSEIGYKPSKADIERERRYRAQSDLETLQRADEIRGDKSRMSACKSYAKEQINTLKKV